MKKIIAIVSALIVIALLFFLSGKLAVVAIQTAYTAGVNDFDAKLAQIIKGTEKDCKAFESNVAVILSKKCTEQATGKPVEKETPKK